LGWIFLVLLAHAARLASALGLVRTGASLDPVVCKNGAQTIGADCVVWLGPDSVPSRTASGTLTVTASVSRLRGDPPAAVDNGP
ncbi:hypothetical protein ACFL59_15280, partial [Planctomycetota bacterium]